MVWTMLWSFYQKKPLFFTVKKKDIHIYWLIVAIIYHSSSVGNTRGALISCGEAGGGVQGEGLVQKNNWNLIIGGVAINEGVGVTFWGGETFFGPA